jgi:protein tyrosine phosphatase (PTP) superfamily phosphohydrolase (DUF442 family)
MRTRSVLLLTALTAAAAGVGTWLTVQTRQNRLVWDHFDEVKRGILYRSGQLNSDQLTEAVRQYGIRTVISFQYPGKGVEAERAHAKKLKIDFMNLPMPGDGFGQEAQFREVLKATDDPDRRPVLIHCARGTCRTGAAVALFRYERDGWTIEDVSREMRRQTYREGWLPGYVYGMVKTGHPARERFEPQVLHDQNLPESTASPGADSPAAVGQSKEAGHVHEIATRKETADAR